MEHGNSGAGRRATTKRFVLRRALTRLHSNDPRTVAKFTHNECTELALDLLAHLEADELSPAEVVDRVEAVTTDPALARGVLGTAELHGIIERKSSRIRHSRGGMLVQLENQVIRCEDDFDYRRYGTPIPAGHFVRFDSGELGPFGSSYVREALGWK